MKSRQFLGAVFATSISAVSAATVLAPPAHADITVEVNGQPIELELSGSTATFDATYCSTSSEQCGDSPFEFTIDSNGSGNDAIEELYIAGGDSEGNKFVEKDTKFKFDPATWDEFLDVTFKGRFRGLAIDGYQSSRQYGLIFDESFVLGAEDDPAFGTAIPNQGGSLIYSIGDSFKQPVLNFGTVYLKDKFLLLYYDAFAKSFINHGDIYSDKNVIKVVEDDSRLGDFVNTGLIEAKGNPVYMYDDAYIDNFINEGELRSLEERGVVIDTSDIDGDFYNSGLIESKEQAIYMRSGDIWGDFYNNGLIESKEQAIYSIYGDIHDDFKNYGSIKSQNSSSIVIVNRSTFKNLQNFGTIDSDGGDGLLIDGTSEVGQILNYGVIESSGGANYFAARIWDGAVIEEFQVSPAAKFVSGGSTNSSRSVLWAGGCYDCEYENEYENKTLQKIVLAGSSVDGIGKADEMSKAILGSNDSYGDLSSNDGSNFTSLVTWQVGADEIGKYDDNDVVWEFGGEGGYADKDGITIDIVRGTAKLTSNEGFGKYFDSGNIGADDNLSKVLIKGNGVLDVNNQSVTIDDIKIDGGTLEIGTDTNRGTLKTKDLDLDGGAINAYVFNKESDAPIQVKDGGSFEYKQGALNVFADSSENDPEGTWSVIEGGVSDEDKLAANTTLIVGEAKYSFEGLNKEVDGGALHKGYLTGGSLNLVIEKKSGGELICELDADDPDCLDPDTKPEGGTKPEPDTDGDGQLDDLPGCEVGDDLCDIISDIEGDEDDASDKEEEIADEIIDGIIDGLEDDEIDLPLMDYGQLAKLVGSGLTPRNVDAAGRGVALHNNLLVDVLFDRQPLRQFEELVAEEVVEEGVVEEEAVIDEAAPVQPLWLKSDELADEEATAYVQEAVAQVDAETAADVEVAAADVSFVDLEDDELDLAKRDGVSAWVKGFGGNSRADDSSILYNDYNLTAYGTSLGVDVALSESFQIGAYANYGDLNVHQHSGETGGGSWNPDGWGGGLTAQYSTRNFYVQGLLGASEFSGEQSRKIEQITSELGGNTAKGDKTVTSYLGALRVGAPFKTGGVVLEPQGQVVWSQNDEHGFSENHGTEKDLRLKYKSRTTNFVETQLGLKLSVPIRTGERALLVPSVRAAWLADWDMGNEAQEIGYKFTKKTVDFDSEFETQNGALIEAGLDYTIQNHNSTAWKIYGRGGVELWDSDRGTTWRASGGVIFQF